ncbi:MAG: endonuclease/exonuclease/phosphatase family protein [Planctomycetota bacterium]|nr:endonuclease/exonuclease/phosphatase family protein [Planctomycetota bacterium]
MKPVRTRLVIVLLGGCMLGYTTRCRADQVSHAGEVRLAAYNVLFGNWAEPEQIGEMFKPYRLDIIGFSEVPDGDWTERVGRILGMKHVYVGKIASANHKDKYKSILSRTPLAGTHEISVECNGWNPASLVGAETVVHGVPLLVYSTHIPERPANVKSAAGSAAAFIADSVIPKISAKHFIIMGDLNNVPGDAALNLIEGKGMRSAWSDLRLNDRILSTHLHIETGRESGLIDHIYFNKRFQAKAVQGGVIYNAFNPPFVDKKMSRSKMHWLQYGKPLSDHRPVWAVLRFVR